MSALHYNERYTRLMLLFSGLLLVSLPFSKAISNICEIGLLLISLLQFQQENIKRDWQEHKWIAVLSIFFLLYVVGMSWSSNLAYGLKFLNSQHRLLVLPIILVINASWYKQQHRRLLQYFVYGLSTASLITLGFFLLPEQQVIALSKSLSFLNDYPINADRLSMGLYSPFIDRIQFSSLLGLGVLSGIYLIRSGERKGILTALTVLLVITTLLLGGRGGQLGLFAGVSILIADALLKRLLPVLSLKIGKRFAVLAILSSVFFLLAVLPVVLYQTVPAIKQRYGVMLKELDEFASDTANPALYEHKTTIRRIISWQNHWEVIKRAPILGVGTGDYLDEMNKAYEQDQYRLPVNSHNQYLQIWVSIGLLGLLAFIAMIAFWFYKTYNDQPSSIFGWSIMGFYVVSFIPDALLLTQIDVMAFSFFFCFLGILNSEVAEKSSDKQ